MLPDTHAVLEVIGPPAALLLFLAVAAVAHALSPRERELRAKRRARERREGRLR
jgi:hypothetical protein